MAVYLLHYQTGKRLLEPDLNIDKVPMGIDNIVPFGLIINEEISNRINHTFPEGSRDRKEISLM